MTKTRPSNKFAKVNRQVTKRMISDVFGRTLTIRVVTETVDDFGQLTARSTADTTFTGDLQYGPDLSERYLSTGMVEVGDAVLYIHPTALATLPEPENIILEEHTSGTSTWEVQEQVEAPELGGTVCHYSYRCKRRIESGDTKV